MATKSFTGSLAPPLVPGLEDSTSESDDGTATCPFPPSLTSVSKALFRFLAHLRVDPLLREPTELERLVRCTTKGFEPRPGGVTGDEFDNSFSSLTALVPGTSSLTGGARIDTEPQ